MIYINGLVFASITRFIFVFFFAFYTTLSRVFHSTKGSWQTYESLDSPLSPANLCNEFVHNRFFDKCHFPRASLKRSWSNGSFVSTFVCIVRTKTRCGATSGVMSFTDCFFFKETDEKRIVLRNTIVVCHVVHTLHPRLNRLTKSHVDRRYRTIKRWCFPVDGTFS